jgi:energy-coupling factor transporter ATP-binding protein EcfA2
MTKWWKCDLQVATPAWDFTMPASPAFDISTPDGRDNFATHYMQALVAKGVNLVAMADHNTGEWIDIMVKAGGRHGIVVFPGCEITTGSGADGIHVIIIGDRTKTSLDFDRLLAGTLGFGDGHPRFHTHGQKQVPGSSGKTLLQILDDLSDDYLIIAPHALNQNGIASGETAQGDIRWKALHHPRLAAVDPGDCSNPTEDSFNDNFRRRSLSMFPCLKSLAFVSTSDAYSVDDLGRRFCWVRMEEASLEALRQAFIDPEARILCDWDPRLNAFPDRDPNRIKHAWLKSLDLGGELGNSSSSLSLAFHPGLNVIIGGRGSGKSTAVAAVRQLYSGFVTLPPMVRQEAEAFSDRIFVRAELRAIHCIQNSQEEQNASWTHPNGSTTQPATGPVVTTNFRIRVVNQKELFERVSHDRGDPLSASRSFLAFVDESLSLLKTDPPQPGSWWRRFEDAVAEWMTLSREYQKAKTDLAQLPAIRSRIRDLETQVSAFDSPEAKARRERNEAKFRQRDALAEKENALRSFLAKVQQTATSRSDPATTPEQLGPEASAFVVKLEQIETEVRTTFVGIIERNVTAIDVWRSEVSRSEWQSSVTTAEIDEQVYLEELRNKGINPDAYSQVKTQLAQQQAIEKTLAAKESKLDTLRERAEAAWGNLQVLQQERREKRGQLLQDVSQRSGRLKFELRSHRDLIGWTNAVRDLLNLRADAFLEDVPTLANWVWNAPDDATRDQHWATWRAALTSGDFAAMASRENADLRSSWQRRLESLDETLRLRLAAEVADDIVQISFLRDGGIASRADDWQDITQGSPGQRTAAMLGFVLHHGDEPLVLDQPEDDLDTEWISRLVVRELRASRWKRQIIVISHNANIPVNGDAERVIVLENKSGVLQVRHSAKEIGGVLQRIPHCGAIEIGTVREDIQNIMEGGIPAFIQREKKYNNEVKITSAIVHETRT